MKKNQDKPQSYKTKLQKKNFLTMDLTERLIRVEQGISSKFDKNLKYYETDHYKCLTPSQKNSFNNYLKNKKKKKIFFSLLFILSIITFGALQLEFTGNVIKDYIGEISVSILELSLSLFVFSAAITIFIISIFRKINNRRFIRHFDLLEGCIKDRPI